MTKVLELETAALTVRRVIYRQHFQESFTSLVALPVPAAAVLETEAEVRELNAQAGADRVQVSGQIAAAIYFQDHDHLWRREEEIFHFQHMLDLPGVRPENTARAGGVATVPVYALEEEDHAVRLKFSLEVLVEVAEMEEVKATVAVAGAEEMRLTRTPVVVENVTGEGVAREIVEHVVELPEEAVQIFRATVAAPIYTAVPEEGEVRLHGSAALQVIYLNSDHALRSHAREIPLEQVLAIPGTAPGQRARFETKVSLLQGRLAETPGKNLVLELSLETQVILSTLVPLDLVTGVGGSGLAVHRRALNLEHVRGETEVREDFKFTSRLPGPAAKLVQAALELERVTGRALENEVAVTGTLVQKLYCLQEEEGLLYHREEIPLAVMIPMAGCKPGFAVTVEARPGPAAAALTEADRVEQGVAIGMAVQVTEAVEFNIVSGVTILEPPPVPARLYLVQPEDTPQVIARRFRVALEKFLEANPQLEDSAGIVPGEKVYIPRF